ncbi:MAG: hypothetical protein HRU32_17595, partial [Rhodobacteraceae bacterium]|nr:hypothetical protein [Paracoccaceae bacterium]
GPDGTALLEIEYFDDRGPLDRRDVSIEITPVVDPILFGFEGQQIIEERDFVFLNQYGDRNDRLRVTTVEMPTTAVTVEMVLNGTPAFQDYALISYCVNGSTNEWLLIVNGDILTLYVNGSGIVDTTLSVDDVFDGTDHNLTVT